MTRLRRIWKLMVKPWSRIIAHHKRLGPIEARAVIDSCFRYIEMLGITALVSVLTSLGGEFTRVAVGLVMSVASGLYLSLPLVRWYFAPLPRSAKAKRWETESVIWMVAVGGSCALSAPLGILAIQLITATIDLDMTKARAIMADAKEKAAFEACARPPSTPASVEKCMAKFHELARPKPPLPRGSRLTD